MAACAALIAVVTAVLPAGARPPETLQVGTWQLELQGQGTRRLLFVDLNSVALYLPSRIQPTARIRSSDLPRALRAEILYDGAIPEQIPAQWRQELMPALGPRERERLRQVWEALGPGDTIRVTYLSGRGTSLLVRDRQVLATPGDALVRGFLDLWIGQDPVSQELRAQLLS